METRTLPLASERAVYQAMFEYLDGSVRPRDVGELSLDTAAGTLRFIDSVCFAAPEPDLVGGELAGWLVESARASAVVTRWRRGARAVLVKAPASVLLSGSTSRMTVDGTDVSDGHVTHEGRFVLVHGNAGEGRMRRDSEPDVVLEDPADEPADEAASAPPPLRSEVQALLTDDAAELAPWSQPPPPAFSLFADQLADLASDDELYDMETRPRGQPDPARRAGGG